MAELVIRLKKNKDGSASLSCTRADGSVTWQRQEGKLGSVFPPHDLTHFAVESVLGYTNAFFGLVTDGWDLADFTQPWPRGRPPMEARQVENLVSGFDMDSTQGVPDSADEYNARLGAHIAGASPTKERAPQRHLTDDEIGRIRRLREELLRRWYALPPGEAMEMEFNRLKEVAT